MASPMTIADAAWAACTLEVLARKPGNVHRYRDFEDLTLLDFLLSAQAIGPTLAEAAVRGVGETVLEGVRRTRAVVQTNTNLGILLLLAPLAAAGPTRRSLAEVLARLTVEDARRAYAAIRLAAPGGLGRVEDQDVAQEPTVTLRETMALAAERDLVARQYVTDYEEVFEVGVPTLAEGLARGLAAEEAVIGCQLALMAARPDSLIARKRGPAEAQEASRLAAEIRNLGYPESPGALARLGELDRWLRGVGHGRNPGATADLVTASLFVALRDGTMQLPLGPAWGSRRIAGM